VHLNVILVVDGYLDYGELRRKWWYDIGGARKLAVGPGVVKGALTELIKYAVAATVAKSAQKANQHDRRNDSTPVAGGRTTTDPGSLFPADRGSQAQGGSLGGSAVDDHGVEFRPDRPSPPPMLEWTGAELLEWLRAMRGFRRTRTYGCLFRLPKPKAEDLGQIIWLGPIAHDGDRYRASAGLLNSITEDKSLGITGPAAYIAMLRGLALPGLRGAGSLGDQIPRDALHSSIEQLQKM
jgi:hypothetical protein